MDLVLNTWVTTLLADGEGELKPGLDGTTLTFNFDGERVSGTAGCNNYFGPGSIEDAVQIGPLVTTLKMCTGPDGIMEQEQRFLGLLQDADSIDITGEHVEVGHRGRTVVVMVPLLGELTGSWSLLFYDNGNQALVSPIPDTEITALFEDGRLRGHSGCNRYTTTYEVKDAALRIPAPAATRMMCQVPDGLMAQEGRYIELLATTASHVITDGRLLDLFDGQGSRILQYARV